MENEKKEEASEPVKTNGSVAGTKKEETAKKPDLKAAATTDPDERPKANNFAEEIYNAIISVYANKNPSQMFCLNWPGTMLDYDRLKWDPSEAGPSGNMPETALIRAAQLMDLNVPAAQITQHDGKKVSDLYKQALRQFAPIPNVALLRLQSIIRSRLQKRITVNINGIPKEMRLVEYCSYLTRRWSDAKRAWGEKQEAIEREYKALYGNGWYNEFIKWFQNNADGYIGAINSAHEDLITEFPLVEWEDALAILEAGDDGGLKEAKTIMRNAVRPLPHQEGLSYVPSTGIPYSWANDLKPSTGFVDLLADPQAQAMALDNALAQVEQEIRAWMAIIPQVDDEMIRKAADKMNQAQNSFAASQKDLIHQFSQNTVEAVKIFCDIMESRGKTIEEEEKDPKAKGEMLKEVQELQEGLYKSNEKGGKKNIDWKMIKDVADRIGKGNDSLIEKQEEVIKCGRELAGAAIDFLENDVYRTKFKWLESYVKQLEYKLETLRKKELEHRSASNVYYNYLKAKPGKGEESKDPNQRNSFGTDTFPSPNSAPQNYRWTQMTIELDKSQLSTSSSLNTYFSQSQWGVDLFLFSGGGNKEVSGAEFAEKYMEAGSTVSIGFLATKVMIDRPWMKPEVFNHTSSFFRTVKKPISAKEQITHEFLSGKGNRERLLDQLNQYSFPSYPVAMLLVKDVVIKVKMKEAMTETLRKTEKSVKSEGGGFLCFSISKSEASDARDESFNSYCMAGQMIARSPAPQILGYWVQFNQPDLSKELSLEDGMQIASALGFLNNVEEIHSTPKMVTPELSQAPTEELY